MINYQKYVDEIINLILVNNIDIDIDNRVKEIYTEIKNIKGINGLLILFDMLSNQIGNEYLGCLHDIQYIFLRL